MHTFDGIVDAYIENYRVDAASEMRFYAKQRNLADAIHYSALCLIPGKIGYIRHPHQRRLRQIVLMKAEACLQGTVDSIRQSPNFASLHRLVDSEIGTISGIGKLTVYDIAHRLGAFLGKVPAVVYLHAGTAAGAKALGFSGGVVGPAELPSAFARLSAAEIEDCLCLYKDEIRAAR